MSRAPRLAPNANLPQLVDIRPLVAYERNARTHSEAQIEQLKEAIRRFGFVGTIAYVPPDALKIGHGRRQAAMEMWEAGEEVPGPGRRANLPKWNLPAIDVSGLDDTELRALVIADNKLALNAGWDEDLLAAEMRALEALDFDLPLVGFDDRELATLFLDIERGENDANAEWQGMPEFDQQDKTAFRSLAVHFGSQEAVDKFAALVGQTITPNTRFLWYPEIVIETYADKRYVSDADPA